MDKVGTIRTQLSYLDPYAHAFIGAQIAAPLYIGIRQTAEFSSLSEDAKRLFPGIDAKLRLVKENAHTPEISFGVQSGIGHTRQSGEYIAASKRYKNFDFTGGIGWGKFATAAHIDNPLKAISSHFDKDRAIDGETSNEPRNWLTGQNIGFFAGVEYFTPLKGLSLKADFGGDAYEAERAAFNFNPPAPWSLGFNYKPPAFKGAMDIGLAAQGTDKILGRISFQGNVKNIRNKSFLHKTKTPLRPFRTDLALPNEMQQNAQKDGIALSHVSANLKTTHGLLAYSKHHSAPKQIGHAAIHMANHAGPAIETITLSPISHGLRGPDIHLSRNTLEKAMSHNSGSIEEIWHGTSFKHGFKGIQKLRAHQYGGSYFKNLEATLDNQISISEEETSLLRRSSIILSATTPNQLKYLMNGFGLRLNIADNLGKLKRVRPRANFPIRSDVPDFADRTIAIDTAFTAFTHTLAPNLHTSVIGGYVEEMFAGLGSEILYRPFDKRYAIGAEIWGVQKRDPSTPLNLGIKQGTLLTAHVNGWYDIPHADLTLGVKAGRYLAKDFGISTSLTKNFKNGATLEGYVSISDQDDFDPFGGTTHADHGLRLSLPLGGYKYTPNTNIRVTAAPFGRDIGQFINNPLPLYKATEPFSIAHITKHWDELND